MGNKIDVEDLTEVGAASTPQTAFENRIKGFCKIGEDDAITEYVAKALPTTVLVMSITNFPGMVQEVGTAMLMANASGNNKIGLALQKALDIMNTSYHSCSKELDIRVPARATLKEVGLEEIDGEADLASGD